MGHTALLVVHGIGAQEKGETLAKLASGLRRVQPDSVPAAIEDGMVTTIGGQSVRLYEVYWADLLKGTRMYGAFQLNELQSLSWFPWYNVRCGNYRSGSYSFVKRVWWIGVLPILNFFILWAYYGARFFAQIFTGDKGREQPSERSVSDAWRKARRRGTGPTALDVILDEYVGDVFSYVNSAGQAFFRETGEPAVPSEVERAYADIVSRFNEQLLRAHADGCETIQVVAHSLGTVVAYHALSGFGFDPRRSDAESIRTAKSKVSRFYTIGSPLEKIRFFWPRIVPHAEPRRDMTLRWSNFVSYFDPVSGVLRTFDDWGPIANAHLLGGGFVRGHVVYERSPVFLDALTEGLCGRAIAYERSPKERLWDLLLLAGETLAAPLTLLGVLAVGVMFFLLVAALLPFLVSLPFRWFVQPEVWAPWVDGAWYILLGALILTFLVAPWNRARKVHALYWAGKRAEPAARQEV